MSDCPGEHPRAGQHEALRTAEQGSVCRERLDHILIVGKAHLRRVLMEDVTYFNRSRPHQGIDQRVPGPRASVGPPVGNPGKVVAFPVLGGLHHDYRRAA